MTNFMDLLSKLVVESVVAGVHLGRSQERELCRAKLAERLQYFDDRGATLTPTDIKGALSDENLGPVEGVR